MSRMYMWQLVGHETSEGPLHSGISADLAGVMRVIEEHLTTRTGFFGHIIQVVPRMSVFHLEMIHVATGREWRSYRDKSGEVYWVARYHPADPDAVYSLTPDSDGFIAG
jgi:hypothetical protein